ncbi:unnamed protein product [Clonostachys chloroleuca]|uniref:CBM1 domain-containing protein n=1 Tax=Clonostachys chloroleuca TaxID=1926264 RepID=A0AA35Q604_9HYPO|nr:unnamed protein product [Clonostachys chloroleuca]
MIAKKLAVVIVSLAATVAVAAVPPYFQCGGKNWEGETECQTGWKCVEQNEWYFQCVQDDGDYC